jgi:P-type E1-E2 ATPase
MLLSGDRAAEVSALAAAVGITETHASKSPEEKVQIIAQETKRGGTIYVGDGINDAPALLTATVGIAFGPGSDITAEAAAVVVLEPKLKKIDEFLHISKRMRRIALESAIGGMAFSFVGVIAASFGYITPLNAALLQEGIDILAVMNALRAAYLPSKILDYQEP